MRVFSSLSSPQTSVEGPYCSQPVVVGLVLVPFSLLLQELFGAGDELGNIVECSRGWVGALEYL